MISEVAAARSSTLAEANVVTPGWEREQYARQGPGGRLPSLNLPSSSVCVDRATSSPEGATTTRCRRIGLPPRPRTRPSMRAPVSRRNVRTTVVPSVTSRVVFKST